MVFYLVFFCLRMDKAQLEFLCQLTDTVYSPELHHEITHSAPASYSDKAQRIFALHKAIKSLYVKHRPTAFKVMVGHHDYDRYPGALNLKVGDLVQLVSYSTEKYIPIKITALPRQAPGYYQGTITHQLVKNSVFEEGDCVYFSEDQVCA